MKGSPAVFLDRDGVINPVVYRDGKTYPPPLSEYRLFGYVPEAVRKLKSLGLKVFVVTNQPDISKKIIKKKELEAVHHRLKVACLFDEILYCQHEDHHKCPCRKPRAGMIHLLQEKWGIDLGQSWMIGDRWRDIEAGQAAGLTTILIGDGYGEREINSDYRAKSLLEACDVISREDHSHKIRS